MSPPVTLQLTVLSGEQRGKAITIAHPISIGSNRGCEVHLRDAAVSWNHARLWVENGEYFVEDLGSANGTWLNGNSVGRANVNVGDILTVGNTRLSLHSAGEGPSADGRRAKVQANERSAPNPLLDRVAEAESRGGSKIIHPRG